MPNFMSYEDAQTVLTEYAEAIKAEKEFTGTQAEWNLLTEAEKKSYVTAGITDDTPVSELLANEYARLDIYSESERMIGQWTDGKPLYQKTIRCTLPTVSVDKTDTSSYIPIGASVDFGQIIVGARETSLGFVPVPMFNGNNEYYTTASIQSNEASTNPNTIRVSHNAAVWSGNTAYVTIQYTKTTDSAVSVGNDTDYSTTEKIVGTWIDGKPIYQKTFTGSLDLGSGTSQTVAHGIANISSIISRKGYIVSGGNFLSFGYTNGNGYFVDAFANTTNIQFRCHNEYNFTPYVITIQYTKTS